LNYLTGFFGAFCATNGKKEPPRIVFPCCARSEILQKALKYYGKNCVLSIGIITISAVPNWSLQLIADTLLGNVTISFVITMLDCALMHLRD